METTRNKAKLLYRWQAAATTILVAGAVWLGSQSMAVAQVQDDAGPDPAAVNMAPVDPNASTDQSMPAPAVDQAPQTYPEGQQSPAPIYRNGQVIQNESQQQADVYQQTGQQPNMPPDDQQGYDDQQGNNNQQGDEDQQGPDYGNDQSVDAGQAALETDQPPPALPEYEQPEAPAPNYMWTPGYWYWSPYGYYWVPGAWVVAPYSGALWTPGYWYWVGGRYRWYHGYWGLHIGFYGGINYGCGYTGYGYYGGYWRGNNFYYNRTVNRVNVTRVTNVYNRTVVVNNVTRVSYNGGRGGLQVQPRPTELAALRETRIPPMSAQVHNQIASAQNRSQFYSQNRGRPAMTVSAKPFEADRGIIRPVARPVQPQVQPRQQGQYQQQARPQVQPQGQFQQPVRPQYQQQDRPEVRQPQQPVRPQGQQPQYQQQDRPEIRQPQYQPPVRPQPQPQYQQQGRPEVQQPQYQQGRPQPQQWQQQQVRPQPQPQYQQQAHPEPQQRAAPQSQPRQESRPQPEGHSERNFR
ncbi:YXWGXW repeat-containing protein [Edaphobacter bradus]|uniref:YXWGXW repeat-containing protein n=1 Tax=Edaphobacter bradus TaxID=2259016 RepID=UPI0021E03C32|nr:YXWGXW repeat-containing protein [Edaphobacter bradus]